MGKGQCLSDVIGSVNATSVISWDVNYEVYKSVTHSLEYPLHESAGYLGVAGSIIDSLAVNNTERILNER